MAGRWCWGVLADGQPARESKVSYSVANRSATHVVRSGVDDSLVTRMCGARDGLVSDHSGFSREADTYWLAV
jgi:hypothetical protein